MPAQTHVRSQETVRRGNTDKLSERPMIHSSIEPRIGSLAKMKGQTHEPASSTDGGPVLSNRIVYAGLQKINVRGKAGAHKVMLMAAIAFNLKKYMKFITKTTLG